MGLGVADKADSHDICFIPHGNTREWLSSRLGEQPGDIVDSSTGRVVGQHAGAYAYTVGQRRGLGVSEPAADGRPRYVLSVSPVTRTVTVGSVEQLDVTEITATAPVWCGPRPALPFTGLAQIRAHGEIHRCTADLIDDELVVRFDDDPARGVAAGQTVVLYDGDKVVGSATINASHH